MHITIVRSKFNQQITDNLLYGANQALADLGVKKDDIQLVEVPGAFEIPYGCQYAFDTYAPDGIVTLGCVVQGETPHFDFICQSTTNAIHQLTLQYNKPITLGILTTNTQKQALQRASKELQLGQDAQTADHAKLVNNGQSNKGVDAVFALWSLLHLS